MENSTIQTALNNLTTREELLKDTNLNHSSIHLITGSVATFQDDDESPPAAWLVYTLFAFNSLLVIFGMFGNVSSILVMLRSSHSLQTYGLLVVALAMTDILGLWTNFFHFLPSPLILNTDIRATTNIGCIVHQVVSLFAAANSAYITALICIDRFLAVQFPLEFKSMVSKKIRVISLCVCACISLLVGLGMSMNYHTINNGICQLGYTPPQTFTQYGLRLLLLGFLTFIPMVILLSLTPIIIFRLKQRETLMAKLRSRDDGTRLIRTSVMLVCVVVAYMILVGIPSVVFTVWRFRGGGGTVTNLNTILYAATSININHAINIFFYNISNKEFREQYLRLIGCR